MMRIWENFSSCITISILVSVYRENKLIFFILILYIKDIFSIFIKNLHLIPFLGRPSKACIFSFFEHQLASIYNIFTKKTYMVCLFTSTIHFYSLQFIKIYVIKNNINFWYTKEYNIYPLQPKCSRLKMLNTQFLLLLLFSFAYVAVDPPFVRLLS